MPPRELCVGSGLVCSKLAHCRKPNPQKVDNHHINIWAQIAHSLVLNTLQETDPCIKHSRSLSLSHTFSVLSPPPTPHTHTHSTQPQRSIAQTEGTLSQLKVTKRQVICQAVPELNPGTGFWGQLVFETDETKLAWPLAPQGLISTPVLPCSSLRSGRQEMAPDPGLPGSHGVAHLAGASER